MKKNLTQTDLKLKKIKDLISLYPESDVREIVTKKICKVITKKKFASKELGIEFQVMETPTLTETKEGSIGYEMYIKAWKDGQQVAFGEDGSVEIERIRVYNYGAYLYEDPNGDIEKTFTIEGGRFDGLVVTKKYREDFLQKFIDDIAHTISLIYKSPENMIFGKVGKTTDTFNPRRVASTRVGTGYFAFNAGANFATWRASASPTTYSTANGSGDPDYCYIQMESRGGGTFGWKVFPWGNFDTSSIPDSNTISAATVSIRPDTSVFAPTDTIGGATIGVTGFAPANENSIALSDMNNWTSTRYATDLTFTSQSTSAYTDFTLNASGIAAISKTGNTLLCYRLGWDIDNTSPGSPANGLYTGASYSFGATNPQKLVVTHSAAASSTNNFFMLKMC